MAPSDYSEEKLVEQPAIELFETLGWQTANLFNEFDSGASSEGRDSKLVRELFPVLII